jgi:hypothetical protein
LLRRPGVVDMALTPMLPECTFITQLIRHYHEITNYSDEQRFSAYAINQDNLAKIFSKSINGMALTAASHFEDLEFIHLILKDPELTLYLDQIPTFFGTDCKIVCVIRDPREVIASLYKVHMDKKENVNKDDLIADVFNYYWFSHQSELTRRGVVHFVRFEKITKKDESEFAKLESYLGYNVGRKGFGKRFFALDEFGTKNSEHYGKPISSEPSKEIHLLNHDFRKKIQVAFSGYNETYHWW